MNQACPQGAEMHRWAQQLWPINRSLTGAGNRETLRYIQSLLPPLQIHGIASGSQVFDWTIPPEWHCREAYIITPDGEKICDYQQNNLHLVGYSTAVNATLPLQQLKKHLYSLPDRPDAIPYVTSYYSPAWGFCLSHRQLQQLPPGDYRVVIDSEHFDGVLNYADLLIRGRSDKEVLLSTYVCHPSMANNELSGPVLVAMLGRWLLQNRSRLRYSWRLVYTPETIGSITYLQRHLDHLRRHVFAGFQVTTVGDDRAYSYIASPYGDTYADKLACEVLSQHCGEFKRYSFLHRGSDERQYCAPHIRLPLASICRSKYGEYPEYHSSADDLESVVTPAGLQGAYDVYLQCIQRIEQLDTPPLAPVRASQPGNPRINCLCEPQLGKRGLYHTLSQRDSYLDTRLLTNVIAYCDGSNSVAQIADIVGADIAQCESILKLLSKQNLLHVDAGISGLAHAW